MSLCAIVRLDGFARCQHSGRGMIRSGFIGVHGFRAMLGLGSVETAALSAQVAHKLVYLSWPCICGRSWDRGSTDIGAVFAKTHLCCLASQATARVVGPGCPAFVQSPPPGATGTIRHNSGAPDPGGRVPGLRFGSAAADAGGREPGADVSVRKAKGHLSFVLVRFSHMAGPTKNGWEHGLFPCAPALWLCPRRGGRCRPLPRKGRSRSRSHGRIGLGTPRPPFQLRPRMALTRESLGPLWVGVASGADFATRCRGNV